MRAYNFTNPSDESTILYEDLIVNQGLEIEVGDEPIGKLVVTASNS